MHRSLGAKEVRPEKSGVKVRRYDRRLRELKMQIKDLVSRRHCRIVKERLKLYKSGAGTGVQWR